MQNARKTGAMGATATRYRWTTRCCLTSRRSSSRTRSTRAIALGLLRVSDPAELYVCGTEQLAEVIAEKRYPNSKELLTELILQFEQNHPGVFMPSTLVTLHKIAEREFGKDSEQTAYLSFAAPKFEKLRDEDNENRNYHGAQIPRLAEKANDQEEENRRALKKIEDETDSADEASMSRAVDALNGMEHVFDLKAWVFREPAGKAHLCEEAEIRSDRRAA